MKAYNRMLVFLVAVSTAVSACRPHIVPPPRVTPDPELMDVSLLTGEPCGPPCWQGIIPGETTREEAMVILHDLSFTNDYVIRRQGNRISFYSDIENWPGGAIEIRDDDIVGNISYGIPYRLELRGLIASMGEPSGFTIGEIGPTGGNPDFREFGLIWPQSGLVAFITAEYNEFSLFYQRSPLNPGMLIRFVDYSEPASNVQEFAESISWLRGRIEVEQYYEWNNYQPLPAPTPTSAPSRGCPP